MFSALKIEMIEKYQKLNTKDSEISESMESVSNLANSMKANFDNEIETKLEELNKTITSNYEYLIDQNNNLNQTWINEIQELLSQQETPQQSQPELKIVWQQKNKSIFLRNKFFIVTNIEFLLKVEISAEKYRIFAKI